MADHAPQETEGPEGRGRRRSARWVAALGVVLALGVVVVVALRPSSEAPEGRAPQFRLEEVRDPSRTVTLDQARGRPVVLNFLASWCPPCRRELPNFQAAHGRHGDRVVFIGIDHQDSRSEAKQLLAEFGITFAVGYDPSGRVAARYGARAMPTTVFIDRRGDVVGEKFGEVSEAELGRWLDRLMDA